MGKKPIIAANTVLAMKALYLFFWGAVFITGQYMAIYLRSFSFTNDLLVGVIMSGGSLAATGSQFLWGYVADHSKTKNRVMLTTIAGVIIGMLLLILPNHTGYLTLLPCFFFFYFFNTVPGMLIDTITVENVGRLGIPFGSVRVFASGGAASGALMLYLFSLKLVLSPITTFIIAAACALISILPASYLPPTKGHAYGAKKSKDTASFKDILQNRRMVLLLFFLLLLFIGVQACNLFLGVYYATDVGMNAGLGQYGLFFAVCIGAETFTMTVGSRFFQRMDIYNIFILASVSAFFRPLIIFLAPNATFMYLLAISQALLFAPLWSRLSPYVNSIVPKEMRATGQAAWSIMVAGVAPMIGSALGGAIAGAFGMRNLFGITSVLLFIVMVVFTFLFRRQRVLEQREGVVYYTDDDDDY